MWKTCIKCGNEVQYNAEKEADTTCWHCVLAICDNKQIEERTTAAEAKADQIRRKLFKPSAPKARRIRKADDIALNGNPIRRMTRTKFNEKEKD